MTGGFVKYTGAEASLLNKRVPSGSETRYNFPNGKYVRVENAVDYKWFEFKAKANPEDWTAKVRLAENEKQFGTDRPQPDPYDPLFKIERERRNVKQEMDKVKAHILQMNSMMLPEEKKDIKKLLEG